MGSVQEGAPLMFAANGEGSREGEWGGEGRVKGGNSIVNSIANSGSNTADVPFPMHEGRDGGFGVRSPENNFKRGPENEGADDFDMFVEDFELPLTRNQPLNLNSTIEDPMSIHDLLECGGSGF